MRLKYKILALVLLALITLTIFIYISRDRITSFIVSRVEREFEGLTIGDLKVRLLPRPMVVLKNVLYGEGLRAEKVVIYVGLRRFLGKVVVEGACIELGKGGKPKGIPFENLEVRNSTASFKGFVLKNLEGKLRSGLFSLSFRALGGVVNAYGSLGNTTTCRFIAKGVSYREISGDISGDIRFYRGMVEGAVKLEKPVHIPGSLIKELAGKFQLPFKVSQVSDAVVESFGIKGELDTENLDYRKLLLISRGNARIEKAEILLNIKNKELKPSLENIRISLKSGLVRCSGDAVIEGDVLKLFYELPVERPGNGTLTVSGAVHLDHFTPYQGVLAFTLKMMGKRGEAEVKSGDLILGAVNLKDIKGKLTLKEKSVKGVGNFTLGSLSIKGLKTKELPLTFQLKIPEMVAELYGTSPFPMKFVISWKEAFRIDEFLAKELPGFIKGKLFYGQVKSFKLYGERIDAKRFVELFENFPRTLKEGFAERVLITGKKIQDWSLERAKLSGRAVFELDGKRLTIKRGSVEKKGEKLFFSILGSYADSKGAVRGFYDRSRRELRASLNLEELSIKRTFDRTEKSIPFDYASLKLSVKKGELLGFPFKDLMGIVSLRKGIGVEVAEIKGKFPEGGFELKGRVEKGTFNTAFNGTFPWNMLGKRLRVSWLEGGRVRVSGKLSMPAAYPVHKFKKSSGTFEATYNGGVLDLGKLTAMSTLVKGLLDILKLRITDIPRGKVDVKDMKFKLKGKGGVFKVEEGYMKTPQFIAVCRGNISLLKETMDLTVGIQPFPTLGKIVGKLPILGKILTGDAEGLEIGVAEIKGSFKKPKIKSIVSKSIGKGILNIIKRTLELPGNLGR